MGTVHGIETDSTDNENDDTDVLSSAIIQDTLGVVVFSADQVSDCVVGMLNMVNQLQLTMTRMFGPSIMERGGVMNHVLMKKKIRVFFLIFAQS